MKPSKIIDANRRFDFALKGNSFQEDTFAVVNMTGVESISRPFQFTLTLVSDKSDIDFDSALESSATLRIFSPDGEKSIPYHGVLSEFEQLHSADGYMFYRAVLVPRFWKLSHYQISEVYLDKTTPQMIKGVLDSSRLSDVELKLTGSYRERSYVCQYQESHLNFLSRWMEKEGMYFYFDHDDGKDKLIILDAKIMQPTNVIPVNYRPINEPDTGHASDSVQGFICRQKALSNKVVLQDYNYRKANVPLRVEEIISDKGTGDVMLYGENFRDQNEGKRYAKIRAEEIRCGSKVFYGEATAVGLRSGYVMKLAHHFRDDFNGEYLITEVTHEGSQVGALLDGAGHSFGEHARETTYHTTFRAIPNAVQFRTERTTAKPSIVGTMNATIDAEGSGEYAELDEYGQYKVQLPFDQTDKAANKSSARVRMVTPYSGSDHGMHFPLHKNAEVILSFMNGDPDQPMIMGAVPNSENKNVVNQNNPSQSVIHTKGGNSIVMDDTEGHQLMHTKAPGDYKLESLGNYFLNVEGSDEQVIEGDSFQTVAGGGQYIIGGLYTSAYMLGSVMTRFGLMHDINVGAYINQKNFAPYIGSTTTARAIETNSSAATINANYKAESMVTNCMAENIECNNEVALGGRMSFINNAVGGGITTMNTAQTISVTNDVTDVSSITSAVGLCETVVTAAEISTEYKGVSNTSYIGDVSTTVNGDSVTSLTGNVMTIIKGTTTYTYDGPVTNMIDGVSLTTQEGDEAVSIEGTSTKNVTGGVINICGSKVETVEETYITTSEFFSIM